MRDLIKGLKGEHTVLVSSHILGEISQICDRYLVIQEGSIIARGTESELATLLGQDGAVEVSVLGSAHQAVQALRGIAGVTDVTVSKLEGDLLALRVMGPGELRPAIVKALVAADLSVLRVDKGTARLENIFLKLTHGKEAS